MESGVANWRYGPRVNVVVWAVAWDKTSIEKDKNIKGFIRESGMVYSTVVVKFLRPNDTGIPPSGPMKNPLNSE
jgi:hypothetical protein